MADSASRVIEDDDDKQAREMTWDARTGMDICRRLGSASTGAEVRKKVKLWHWEKAERRRHNVALGRRIHSILLRGAWNMASHVRC